MFTSNTKLSRCIRENIFTYVIFHENLINENISDFSCTVDIQFKKSRPTDASVDYVVKYYDIDESDDVEEITANGKLKMKYIDLLKLSQGTTEYAQKLLKERMYSELRDYIRKTKLHEIPNQKVEDLLKHLQALFKGNKLILSDEDTEVLKTIIQGNDLGLYSGVIHILGNELQLEYDMPTLPQPKFIDTADEIGGQNV